MNRSLPDIGGSVLLVSQFTLLGRTTNGRRPSFDETATPAEAKRLNEGVANDLRAQGIPVETGVFAAHMQVELLNDGAVTFVLDSRERETYVVGGKSEWLMAYGTNKESLVFSAHAIGHQPYAICSFSSIPCSSPPREYR